MSTLHLQHASLRFNVERRDLRPALKEIFNRRAHVVTFTEASEFHRHLERIGYEAGYELFQPFSPITGRMISTPVAFRIELLNADYIPLVPPLALPASAGGHGDRGLTSAQFEFEGDIFNVNLMHVLTGWGGADAKRKKQILHMWETSLKVAKGLAWGLPVSTLVGDVNYDPDDPSANTPSELLQQYGFTSVFDEAKNTRGTHGGRQIDQIYTFNRDRRVSVNRVVVHKWLEGLDHKQVSAFLEIGKD